ncbi:MAG: Shedu immune nuclease family protein [Candidatus Beckwithbacteria bacterium]|nr:DUF4263 domain-containing protein [Patescibacteria group bacterium]
MGFFDFFNPSEADILTNKKAGIIYMADFPKGEGKYISAVIEDNTEPYDLSLQISPKIEVRITYINDDEKITGVQISKLAGGRFEKINLSTLGFKGVLGLLQIFSNLDLKSIANRSILLDSQIIHDEESLRAHLNTLLSDEKGLKMLAELATSKGIISEGDIGNISKKREALDIFKKLLSNNEFFALKKKEWGKSKDEDVWQKFFEDNKWIFGYGLEYVFNAPIDKNKFEQTLKGNNFLEFGKRPDGVLKTLGIVQFLNIVEIKTNKKPLMDENMYRSSQVWQPSSELSGAVSQSQQYIRASIKNLTELIELKDVDGNRTGKEIFVFNPKCFLIIGDMHNEFIDGEKRVLNPDKLACFEYYRKNLFTPEIITFDQLYFRAKNIIEGSLKNNSVYVR